MMQIKRSLVRDAYKELAFMAAGEACEHDVNICWCGTFDVLHRLEEALELAEEDRAKETASRRYDFVIYDEPITAVTFRCENCHSLVRVNIIEGSVTCYDCDHTVDVGVYVHDGES